ncbi:MAG: diaminopimelate epimerase [Dehalococcoidia bacterium]|nr:diaminopimelate epimerase [Dehalococcoidia bacterium]
MDFAKMHGTGNDFVVVDGRGAERDWPRLAIAMCDRHFGVGADGILVVEESAVAPLRMRMYNPDGSEAEMCGNGIRCFVKYAVEGGIVAGVSPLAVETGVGVLEAEFWGGEGRVERVRVNLGPPHFAPEEVPVRVDGEGPVRDLAVDAGDRSFAVTCVSMGNPHAVTFLTEPVAAFPLETVGPRMEHHALFPRRTNFEIVRVLDREHLEMRVWERGAGMTMACGTGAAAVAVAARLHGFTGDTVAIELPGGWLDLAWDGEGPVYLSGPAVEVFRGVWPEV